MCIRDRSDSEIDKAVKEAAEYEAQDKKKKEAIDVRNDADAMVFQTEKAMEEVGDKIDAADKTAVEEDLKALKELVEKTNPEDMTDAQIDDLKAGKEKLMSSAQKLFAKVYAVSYTHLHSSGFSVLLGSWPVSCFTFSCTDSIRVEPPTSSTLDRSDAFSPASLNAFCTGAAVLSTRS